MIGLYRGMHMAIAIEGGHGLLFPMVEEYTTIDSRERVHEI